MVYNTFAYKTMTWAYFQYYKSNIQKIVRKNICFWLHLLYIPASESESIIIGCNILLFLHRDLVDTSKRGFFSGSSERSGSSEWQPYTCILTYKYVEQYVFVYKWERVQICYLYVFLICIFTYTYTRVYN